MDILGVKEAADFFAVKKSNFLRDIAGRPDFPKPLAKLASTQVWLRADLERYEAKRRHELGATMRFSGKSPAGVRPLIRTEKVSVAEKLLEMNDAAFHDFAEALLKTAGYSRLKTIGFNRQIRKSVCGTPDTIAFSTGGQVVAVEITTDHDPVKYLKNRDKESGDTKLDRVHKKLELERGYKIEELVFVSNRRFGERHFEIEKLIEAQGWKPNAFGLDEILLVISMHPSLKRLLSLPELVLETLDQFEKKHRNRLEDAGIFYPRYVRPFNNSAFERIKEFLNDNKQKVALVHGTGGIGKTRLAIEALLEHKAEGLEILVNKSPAGFSQIQVENEISDLPTVLLLDDAHCVENLVNFRDLFLRNGLKVILTVRSTAEAQVRGELGAAQPEIIEVQPLTPVEATELLRTNLNKPLSVEELDHVVRVCEGNPFLLGGAVGLINSGAVKSAPEFKKSELVTHYVNQVVSETGKASAVGDVDHLYEPLLACIFILRPFSDAAENLVQSLCEFLSIDRIKLRTMLRTLTDHGVIERYHNDLWLYPDLLGEHIAVRTFFGASTIVRIEGLLDGVPGDKRKTTFRAIRELSHPKADAFLHATARTLAHNVSAAGNIDRANILDLLATIAPAGADSIVEAVEEILANEKPPERGPHNYDWTHGQVVNNCLDILNIPAIKFSNLEKISGVFERIYFLGREREDLAESGKRAAKMLAEIASFNLNIWEVGSGFAVQRQFADKLKTWWALDPEKYLDLILEISPKLLSCRIEGYHARSNQFTISFGPPEATDELKTIRRQVLELLCEIFRISESVRQLRVVDVFQSATGLQKSENATERFLNMVEEDAEFILEFYQDSLTLTLTLPVKRKIEEHALRIQKWCPQLDAVATALWNLYEDDLYRLYRMFTESRVDHLGNADKDWREIENDRQAKIQKLLEETTDGTVAKLIKCLDTLSRDIVSDNAYEWHPLMIFLYRLSAEKPSVAEQVIEGLGSGFGAAACKSELVRGLRASGRCREADNFIVKWLESGQAELLNVIPVTYYISDNSIIKKQDMQIFKRLADVDLEPQARQVLDQRIMAFLPRVLHADEKLGHRIVFEILSRDPAGLLIENLWISHCRKDIDLHNLPKRFWSLVNQRLLNMPSLDYENLALLAIRGRSDPVALLAFFRERIEIEAKSAASYEKAQRYDAIPYYLDDVAKTLRAHADYRQAVRTAIGWLEDPEWLVRWETAHLLNRISIDLDPILKEELLLFMSDGKAEKIHAVMELLKGYASLPVIDELCREAVVMSKGDPKLWSSISAALSSTGTVCGERGFIEAWETTVARIEAWQQDPNDQVKKFAAWFLDMMNRQIDSEEKRIMQFTIRREKGWW